MAKSPTEIRAGIVEYCQWACVNERQIHYAQSRPMPKKPRSLPYFTDCSGFATLAYQDAGAPNPNGGRYYDGYGYTGTMMQNGDEVKIPYPGDLIIYGKYPGHHVVVYLYTWHGAWIVASHGGEYGPIKVLQHREEISQPSPKMIRRYLPVK
jgi:cell wall-associated NlpC family hydrolase